MNANAKVELDKVQYAVQLLKKTYLKHKDVVFTSSLSVEDMLITDLIAKHVPEIRVVTLDTGRLHEETYQLLQKAQERYEIEFDIYYPDPEALQEFVKQNGINAFYKSQNFRKSCCQIRKVEPLKLALSTANAWVTGLRREQSVTRTDMKEKEWDEGFQVEKVNPLIDWTSDEIWDYVKNNDVPYNELHDRNFPSIGCSPCTRAITVGEDPRSGRWWWENPETKECGLHIPVKNLQNDSVSETGVGTA